MWHDAVSQHLINLSRVIYKSINYIEQMLEIIKNIFFFNILSNKEFKSMLIVLSKVKFDFKMKKT